MPALGKVGTEIHHEREVVLIFFLLEDVSEEELYPRTYSLQPHLQYNFRIG